MLGYRIIRQQHAQPLLTLIHGLASNCTRFSEFVEFTQLKDSWDILRVDLRGHGSSMYRGNYTRNDWVEDLNTIFEQEQYQQSVLLGHSLGAQVAIEYAHQHPDRARGLILIDPVFPENLQGLLGKAKRYQYILAVLRLILRILGTVGIRRWWLSERDLRALDETTRQTLKDNPQLTIAELYTNPFADFKYIPLLNYLQDIREVIRPLPPLEEMKVPVLVLLSGGATVSVFDVTTKIIARFPQSQIEVIDADHWLLTEKPEQTRQVIEHWCNQMFSK